MKSHFEWESAADSLGEISLLNSYGIEIRYPGDMANIEPEDAHKVLKLAKKLRETVLQSLLSHYLYLVICCLEP